MSASKVRPLHSHTAMLLLTHCYRPTEAQGLQDPHRRCWWAWKPGSGIYRRGWSRHPRHRGRRRRRTVQPAPSDRPWHIKGGHAQGGQPGSILQRVLLLTLVHTTHWGLTPQPQAQSAPRVYPTQGASHSTERRGHRRCLRPCPRLHRPPYLALPHLRRLRPAA